MLHHQDSLYQHGRSNRLFKLKPYDDAEAVVIGYRPGKGQFTGKMGSLKVRAENGKEFYIGTGFSQREREDPPPLGSRISFRHQGYTDKGTPRFAVFIRIRDEP
jgi:DNA ligase-1